MTMTTTGIWMTGTTESHTPPLVLVLMAAGSSSRMGGTKKEFLPVSAFRPGAGENSVLSQALLPFLRARTFRAVAVTVAEGKETETKNAILSSPEAERLLTEQQTELLFVRGGTTRQQSVLNALRELSESGFGADAVVLVHDGARPFLTERLVARVADCAVSCGAAVPYVPAVDTLKLADSTLGTIVSHLDRSTLAAVQTPQAFTLGPFLACHEKAAARSLSVTDDTELWDAFPELTGSKKVRLVEGETSNRKLTYLSDMEGQQGDRGMEIRTGLGIDTHRLTEGRKLVIGGIEIPFEKGEAAHSDGDVLLHAITDALLGASAMGDIGSYFPPEDMRWKDADSAGLLKTVWNDVRGAGWRIQNIDCVLELEKPKFLPHRERVRESVAGILGIQKERVFVKAKTAEGLESIGHGEAVKATCTCLLSKSD